MAETAVMLAQSNWVEMVVVGAVLVVLVLFFSGWLPWKKK